jgi:hypothetical protein
MRSALLLLLPFALVACQPVDPMPTQSTALPPLSVTLISKEVDRDRVLLAWVVENDDGRLFEFLRQNRAEPWKHFSTAAPVDGRISVNDDGVVPGQTYRYRVKVLGTPRDRFLDEVEVVVPIR